MMRLMRRHSNVYADTSGVRRFDSIDWAVQYAGPNKILFGTDGPWLHPELELSKIRLLGLGAAEESLILGGNILRLIHESGTPDRFTNSARSDTDAKLMAAYHRRHGR
jgi:predicted TIM-barrel fold metal-dependent hydrolase